MRIDIWSDLVCPWCWIGSQRMRRGLQGVESVELRWQPFLLDPDADATPQPLREFYATKFGGAAQAARMLSETQATARAEGLPMDFDRGQVRVSTRDAHRVLGMAAAGAQADAVAEALFRAHFAEGRNLADAGVLADCGAAGGLEREAVLAMLAGDAGKVELEASLAQARAMGIRAVPTFVIDGRYALQGGQPPEVWRQVLARLGRLPPAADQRDAQAQPPATD
ncbi:DsbA family oxidoreductase [Luteimonas sp. e5]